MNFNALGRVLPQYAVLHGVWEDTSPVDSLYTFAAALILRAAALGTSGWLWVHLPAQLCCPEVGHWAWAPECSYSRMAKRQYWGCFLTPDLQGVVLSLGFLLPVSLSPSWSWSVLTSMLDHSSVTNHCCWAVKIRISPLALRILQTWGLKTCLPGRGKLKVICFH